MIARAASAAAPMAKPLPMAAVVLPSSSRLSVISRTSFSHLAHLGDAAGVVRDRAIGVDRHGDADGSQHAHGRDADAVETGQL